MIKCLFIIMPILFTGCFEQNIDSMLLAKYNVLCKDHFGAKQVSNRRELNRVYSDEVLLCKDGYIIKNFNLDQVYGQEVFEEYQKLEKLNTKEK